MFNHEGETSFPLCSGRLRWLQLAHKFRHELHGDFDLWPSKKAFTDAMYKQLLIAEIVANSKRADTEQLECVAKEMGLNVSYPNIDL